MKISVKEIKKLVEWLDEKGIAESDNVTLKSTPTGIGIATEASVELKKGEGIWIDLTDYDAW